MTRGGPRNRSGPQKDENSFKSAALGISFHSLPAEGYGGKVPQSPIPDFDDREAEVWEAIWKTPQAAAWASEPWRWRVVALYVRWSVKAEDANVPAAVMGQVHRLADQIGLTPAGLKENGWKIGAAEDERKATGTSGKQCSSSRARLKVVGNDE